MLTAFGKTLRKIRIENDELLKEMAAKLNVTSAYLSAVENGNREVPDSWIDILATEYNLSNEEKKELQLFAYEKKENIKINLQGMEKKERELALAFARSINGLTEKEIDKLLNIFNR